MLAGLDVGGTHTDAVLVDRGRCLARAKAPTRPGNPLPGMLEALRELFACGYDPAAVRRLTVSTTLGLNALLTGETEPVGMLAVPGPGLDLDLFWPEPGLSGNDPLFRVLAGAQDHRGRVTAGPDQTEVESALVGLKKLGACAIGIAVKFSPKNPDLEHKLGQSAALVFGPDTPVVLGSSVSGSLNFPRRLHTVWCNAALAATTGRFKTALESMVRKMGLVCPVFVLKADAGTFSLAEAAVAPASSMGSGPAASLLGVWALTGSSDDTLMIDMGGTSTDLALLAGGEPLLAPQGLCVAGRPTLIRTLLTSSLAVGGDSSLRVLAGKATVGPDRSGPALSLANQDSESQNRPPTLTDALNVLGLCQLGDTCVSRAALQHLANLDDCPAAVKGKTRALSRLFIDIALAKIAEGAKNLLTEVNSRPVYTIKELIIAKKLRPTEAVFIGGPAKALAEETAKVLGLPTHAPPKSASANAIGAALAQPTQSAELYADTLTGRMTIPNFNLVKSIDRHYDLKDARADLLAVFADEKASPIPCPPVRAPYKNPGPEAIPEKNDAFAAAQIVFAERFAVLDSGAGRGLILRLGAQCAAGLAEKGVIS